MTTRHTYLDQEKGWSVWDTAPDGRLSFVRKCRETGIAFISDSMRGIRANRKFQTRRLFQYQPERFEARDDPDTRYWHIPWKWGPDGRIKESDLPSLVLSYSRYGQPGDILWCRESYCTKIDPVSGCPVWSEDGNSNEYWYKADGVEVVAVDDDGGIKYTKQGYEASPWKSPMFMPRVACRELLLLTNIRVQRVGEISEEDCFAEGYDDLPYVCSTCHGSGTHPYGDVCSCEGGRTLNTQKPIEWYAALWDSINAGKPGCSFAESPYVWVLTFERIGGGK